MKELHFSTEAQMALARMTFVYERENNCRVKLSDDAQIVQLLNDSLGSVNQELKRYFQQFVALLSRAEVNELIYRGVKIDSQSAMPETPAPAGAEGRTTTYRGVVTTVAQAEMPEPAAPASAKPKRVYRGQVVED